MKIKTLSLLIAICMIFCSLAFAVSCQNNEIEQTEGEKNTESETPTVAESEKSSEIVDVADSDTESTPADESDSDTLSGTGDENADLGSEDSSESKTESATDTEDDTEPDSPNADITAEKTVSHSAGKTVYPGEIITYSFVLKNKEKRT